MKVLITGVCGLIGSRFAEHVLAKGHTVVGIDDLSGGYLDNLPKGVEFYAVDAGDPVEVENIFKIHGGFDLVYHFAAYAAECVSPFIRRFNYTNNLVVSTNIVNLCIKYNVGRLVFTSSMAVYGAATPPFSEDLIPNPIDPYGVAKFGVEMDIQIAGQQHGLDWCIIRPHNMYGRNQSLWDSYRNFIGIAMYKALVGDPITIFGDGLQTRAFSYIDDSLEPLWHAGVLNGSRNQIINLGGTVESTILEVGNLVAKLGGVSLVFLPPRHEVRYAHSTWDKSVKLLGFSHNTDLEEGITKMWEWAKLQPKRERFIWKNYEVEKGLYPQWQPEALKDGYYNDKAT